MKTLLFAFLFFGSIYWVAASRTHKQVDLPEEIQACEVGDTLIVESVSRTKITLGFKHD